MVGKFKVEVKGDDIGSFLNRAAKLFKDGTKLTEPISTDMMRESMERIEEGIQPELSPATGRSGTPLRDTGRLMNSIRASHDANAARTTAHHEWAYVHQFGAIIKAKEGTRHVSYTTKSGKTVEYDAPNVLAWKGKDGKWHFAKKVVIPKREIFKMTDRLKRRIRNSTKEALERLRAETPKIKQTGGTA